MGNLFFIDISWRCLKSLIALVALSDNLVIFKFRNSNLDLKENFVNNYKKNSNAFRFLNTYASNNMKLV